MTPEREPVLRLFELRRNCPCGPTLDLSRAATRIDSYRATVDGRDWKPRIGWSRVLDGLRKALPRLASIRKMEA